MWCMYRESAGSIAENTINLTILERRSVRPIEYSDTATYERPAHIKKVFSEKETLGWYYITSSGETNPEVKIQFNKGTLIELTFDYIISDESTVPVYTTSGLTADLIYINQFDSDLFPVGRSQTALMSM